MLEASDFLNAEDEMPLKDWSQLDQLGLCARYEENRERGQRPEPANWKGEIPEFRQIEWRPDRGN